VSVEARCSDGARARRDPPQGTAPGGTRWLLLEQDGDWAPNPQQSVDAPWAARRDLGYALQAAAARLELIRRPVRPAERAEPRRWAVLDTALGVEVWGVRDAEGGWGGALDALRDPLAAGARPGPGVLLVCTHGRHDACCAKRGRPVASALAEEFPEETWECTHLGGDRFAANVAVMPDGALYGFVDAAGAARLVAEHRAGVVDRSRFRGLVGREPAVQVALTAVADELGLLPWDRRLDGALRSGTQGRWVVPVTLDAAPCRRVRGHLEFREPAPLTCGAEARSAVVPVIDEIAPAASEG